MARYIDADILIEHIKDVPTWYEGLGIGYRPTKYPDGMFDCNDVINSIENQPTVEIEEVKHGEWIEDAYYDNPCVCSYCGVEAPYFNKFEKTFDYDWEENLVSTGHKTIKEYIRTQYCHRCGAKMDGGKTE